MKLKELREKNQLSQIKLSKELNLNNVTYGRYELGDRQPDIQTLCQIADYYGVTLDYLCDHKTQNIIDQSQLPTPLIEIINVAKNFSEKQLYMLQGATIRISQEI